MDAIGPVGPARALGHGARRELAAALREGRNDGSAVGAFLDAYGSAVYDFVMLMLGPGQLADRVVVDTTVAVACLAGWLKDDDMLTAWVFALARCECRRYPPVVWRERHWEGLRSLAIDGPMGQRDSVPMDVVRMAMLGIAPKDREVLVLSSTYCKLLSSDLAAVFRISGDSAATAVAEAHARFEQALGLCAEEVGYQRDPRNRAPEIGELVGMVLSGIDRRLPADQVFHVVLAPELEGYRRQVISRIHLNKLDGFPLLWNQGRAREHLGAPRHPEEGRPRRMARHARADGRYGTASR